MGGGGKVEIVLTVLTCIVDPFALLNIMFQYFLACQSPWLAVKD